MGFVCRIVFVYLALLWAAPALAAPLGQWVWSRADVAVLSAARTQRSDIEAAVNVAEISVHEGHVRSALRLSPTSAPHARAVVVRFDASFHAAWELLDETRTNQASAALQRIVDVVRATAPEIAELQLDYDCPTRRLADWAALLHSFAERGVTRGFTLWTTSLVAHLRAANFGALFRELVAGHIVQVFDTGEAPSEAATAELTRLLTRAAVPFRVAVGAFERAHEGRQYSAHFRWWDALPSLAQSELFRGTWVFSAGQAWTSRVRGMP